jgi:hypothetical protein
LQNLSSGTLFKALFLFVWVICGFALFNFRQIARLRNVAAHFNGTMKLYSLFVPAVEGIWENIRFSVHAGPRFEAVLGTLKIRLMVRPLIVMRVFRKSMLAKIAGKLRELHEVKTGDPLFDADFTVFARDAETAGSYLQQTTVRQGLRALFEYGFWMLVTDDRGVWAEKVDYDRKLDLGLTRLSSVLRFLKRIATGT